LAIEQKFESLQVNFEKELNEKKRLIEEADNAFEAQAKAEDEHYQMKLSKMTLEKEFSELVETNKQLEQDFNNLMDDMLVLEKQDLKKGGTKITTSSKGQDTVVLQEKIHQLEKENEKHRHSLSAEKNQVSQLSKDVAELESLIESRVFGEADLEEQLEAERKKVASLERELTDLKNHTSSHIISPSTTTAASSPTSSSNHNKQQYAEADDDLSQYCELCERYGHDILQCKSELSLSSGGKLVKCQIYI
jgi:chromosome segregation ATPase